MAVTPLGSLPRKTTLTLSGTLSQVRPLAAAKAMSVAPIPVPKAPTAP